MVRRRLKGEPPGRGEQMRPRHGQEPRQEQGQEQRQEQRQALGRRQFLTAACGAIAGGLVLGGATRASRAQGKFAGEKVVFASWGGIYQEASKKGYCDAFAAKTGATVIQDGPVDYAKLRTMIQNGSPTWDVVDVTIDFLYNAAKDGLFEKIDTTIVDTKGLPAKYVHDYGVANIVWSYNIAFNAQTFPDGKHPKTWSEFLDVGKFPGRRALRDRVNPMLEIALLADGVPFERLYPLDVDRALKKLDAIKKNAVWWTTNSQSQQLMIDGECTLGILNNGRIYDAVQKGAKIGIEWAQNLQSVDYLVVPKGSKVKNAAMGLIAEMVLPESQARVSNIMPLAPTNPEAFKLITKEVAPWLSTEPANLAQGFPINEEYWRDHYKTLAERWTAWKLS
jgi:putative spermidine/putrescine transport system substrate-binding protein